MELIFSMTFIPQSDIFNQPTHHLNPRDSFTVVILSSSRNIHPWMKHIQKVIYSNWNSNTSFFLGLNDKEMGPSIKNLAPDQEIFFNQVGHKVAVAANRQVGWRSGHGVTSLTNKMSWKGLESHHPMLNLSSNVQS